MKTVRTLVGETEDESRKPYKQQQTKRVGPSRSRESREDDAQQPESVQEATTILGLTSPEAEF
jgi:hypothetical protein